jgi:hypothetical protein
MRNWMILFGVLVLAGCAAQQGAPTHRWVSHESGSTDYRRDNLACTRASRADLDQLDRSSAEFKAYQACMNARGYQLAEATSSAVR